MMGSRDRSPKFTARGAPNACRSAHKDPRRLDRSRPPGRRRAPGGLPLRPESATPLSRDCRTSEIEFDRGDPDAVHDHRKLAGHGDGGTLYAATLATETPQARRRDHLRVPVISADAAS